MNAENTDPTESQPIEQPAAAAENKPKRRIRSITLGTIGHTSLAATVTAQDSGLGKLAAARQSRKSATSHQEDATDYALSAGMTTKAEPVPTPTPVQEKPAGIRLYPNHEKWRQQYSPRLHTMEQRRDQIKANRNPLRFAVAQDVMRELADGFAERKMRLPLRKVRRAAARSIMHDRWHEHKTTAAAPRHETAKGKAK